MFARVVWKMILAFSIVLAIALLALWLRTQKSDLLVSGARGGTYRELRFSRGEVGVTLVPGWPVAAEHVRIGRPIAAAADSGGDAQTLWRNPVKPPVASASSATRTQTLTLQRTRTMALFDGTSLTLLPPAAQTRWPPLQTRGGALVEGFPRKAPVTMPSGNAVAVFYPPTQPSSISPAIPATMQATGTVTLTFPSTNPTLSAGGGAAATGTSSANAVIAGLRTSGDITFRVAPTSGPAFANVRTIAGMIFAMPGYTYERYAAPMWALMILVLLPVWVALALASARAARRRTRRHHGLCESCGYDLRGSPSGGACPECGAADTLPPVAPTGEALLARLR